MQIKHCELCGESFTAKTRKARYCVQCRPKAKSTYMSEYMKNNHTAPKKHTPRFAKKSIGQIVGELEEYNRTHNKSLTYGQYVAMMEGGE